MITPARVGLAALLLAAAWLGLSVRLLHRGNLAGLFHTGRLTGGPPVHRVDSDLGYDGQFYRMTAHDPLIRGDAIQHVDNPRLRWRRIGVPGFAALLSFGHAAWVDPAYVAIEAAFVFLGAWWLALFAQRLGRSPAWGLAFLAVPAVAVSIERMTIDLPLAALAIGLCVASPAAVPFMLCAAPLVRETGMLLIAAMAAEALARRDGRAVAIRVACAGPALAWWSFVHANTPVDATAWLSTYPYGGLIARTWAGNGEPTNTAWLRLASTFEETANAGIWLAISLAAYLAWTRAWAGRWNRSSAAPALTAIAFAVFAGSLGRFDIWSSAYAAGRTMSPMLLALALVALTTGRWIYAAPLALVVPRIALQFEAQAAAMWRSG